MNVYLWRFYTKAQTLELELEEAQKLVRNSENSLLSLTGRVQALEADVVRVQQFDAKLRVLMNIDKVTAPEAAAVEESSVTGVGGLNHPIFLTRHRELFTRRLHSLVDELADSVHLEEIEQQSLVSFLRLNNDALLSTPSIWPVQGYLTSGFGYRSSPFTGKPTLHRGLDISNRIGMPIRAPARGTVTFVGTEGGYGSVVILDHGNNITTRYAHLSKVSVKVGQYVQRGEVIAALGNSGRSTGPHLHYEVLVNGVHVNPLRYILN